MCKNRSSDFALSQVEVRLSEVVLAQRGCWTLPSQVWHRPNSSLQGSPFECHYLGAMLLRGVRSGLSPSVYLYFQVMHGDATIGATSAL